MHLSKLHPRTAHGNSFLYYFKLDHHLCEPPRTAHLTVRSSGSTKTARPGETKPTLLGSKGFPVHSQAAKEPGSRNTQGRDFAVVCYRAKPGQSQTEHDCIAAFHPAALPACTGQARAQPSGCSGLGRLLSPGFLLHQQLQSQINFQVHFPLAVSLFRCERG